jgi:hypothetical protein
MITLVLGLLIVLLLLAWSVAWKRDPRFAFGIFIGIGVAWAVLNVVKPYLTGRVEMPLWLPPLPVLTIALTLMVLGIVVWFRGDENLPTPPPPKDEDGHH